MTLFFTETGLLNFFQFSVGPSSWASAGSTFSPVRRLPRHRCFLHYSNSQFFVFLLLFQSFLFQFRFAFLQTFRFSFFAPTGRLSAPLFRGLLRSFDILAFVSPFFKLVLGVLVSIYPPLLHTSYRLLSFPNLSETPFRLNEYPFFIWTVYGVDF